MGKDMNTNCACCGHAIRVSTKKKSECRHCGLRYYAEDPGWANPDVCRLSAEIKSLRSEVESLKKDVSIYEGVLREAYALIEKLIEHL